MSNSERDIFEAPIIINSLCLLKRNNLITRHAINIQICYRFLLLSEMNFVYIVEATMYTNHHHLHMTMNRSIFIHPSLSKKDSTDYIDVDIL